MKSWTQKTKFKKSWRYSFRQ